MLCFYVLFYLYQYLYLCWALNIVSVRKGAIFPVYATFSPADHLKTYIILPRFDSAVARYLLHLNTIMQSVKECSKCAFDHLSSLQEQNLASSNR